MKWFVVVMMLLFVSACEDGTRRIYPNDKGTAVTDADVSAADDLLVDEGGDEIVPVDALVEEGGDEQENVSDEVEPPLDGVQDAESDGTTAIDEETEEFDNDDEVVSPDDGDAVQAEDDTLYPDGNDGSYPPDHGDVVQPDIDVDTCECSTGDCCDGCYFRPASYLCRPAQGQCDVAEYCTGASAACPSDGFAFIGTSCDDGIFCNGDDTCNGNGGCTIHAGNPCGNFVCSENQGRCCDPGWAGADCEICVRFVTPPGMLPIVGDGLSWNTAFTKLQQAIDSAATASGTSTVCEVWVAAGSYYIYETATSNTVTLKSNVHLYGGFTGTEWLREERDWANNVTIVDGRQSDSSGNRVSHIFIANNGTTNVLVDGFTIKEGRAVTGNTSAYAEGGAMYLNNASVTVRNCLFTMNSAISQADDTYARGGAISAFGGGTLVVERSVFRYNAVIMGSGRYGFGGALYATDAGTVTVINSIFDTNSVSENGNGSTEGSGGAINVFNGRSLRVENCLFHDNSLVSSGAANGGAIRGNDASIQVVNSTFAQNAAKNGGAIANLGDTNTTITNSILYFNNATNVWSNTRQLYDETGGGSISASYSDIQMTNTSVFPGTGNKNGDPLFVDVNANDFHLKADAGSMQLSPCIDAANDAVAPATDLEGNSRFDVPIYGTSVADMGCYEFVY